MYEIIKVINETNIEVIERKFRFKFTAQRAADRLNNAAKPTGFVAALGGTGRLWQVQDTKTVTAMLATALEAAVEAAFTATEINEDPRSTQEIMKAIDEGHALSKKPVRAPRSARAKKPPADTEA